MPEILCPVCGQKLDQTEKSFRCAAGHSFDVARQGYVNLLTVTDKHSLHPGDTREQVAARRRFLRAGHYAPIAGAVCEIAQQVQPQTILDAGCGEGYYLSQIGRTLPQAQLVGLDISKEAVRSAAAQDKRALWLAATAARLPFSAESFDLIVSMFSLTVEGEYRRCLKSGGYYLQVLAGQDHLMGLKNIIYPQILLREKTLHPELGGFALERSGEIRFEFTLDTHGEIADLLSMTPHFWRITKEGAARLETVQTLHDSVSVVWNLYRAV